MELAHAGVKLLGDRRDERNLEGPGGDHHLPGLPRLRFRPGDVAAVASGERGHHGAGPHRQLEVCRVGPQVIGDVVFAGVGIGRGGEGQSRQVVVLGWGERPQRIPPRPPGGADLGAGVHDLEVQSTLRQVVAHGQAGLAAADHQHVQSRCPQAAGLIGPTPGRGPR